MFRVPLNPFEIAFLVGVGIFILASLIYIAYISIKEYDEK